MRHPRYYLTRTVRRTAATLNDATKPAGVTGPASKVLYDRWVEACGEAMDLVQLESRGCGRGASQCSCRGIGDVLDMGAESLQALREFVIRHPEEQEMVEQSLRFRQMVCESVAAIRVGLAA